MPKVNRKTPDRNHTQSVLFQRDQWTVARAKRWLRDHDHFTDGLDTTKNLYRFRQYNPDAEKFRYRNRAIGDGITLVLAFKRATAEKGATVYSGVFAAAMGDFVDA